MIIPRLTTFVHSQKQVEKALAAGARGLIIDDPMLSIRSFHPQPDRQDIRPTLALADYIKRRCPDAECILNIDMLCHEADIKMINRLLPQISQSSSIDAVRVQDIGLLSYFLAHAPRLSRHFAPETGSDTPLAAEHIARYAHRHSMATDGTADHIQAISDAGIDTEIYVQGPLLLQYSHRRYLADHYHDHQPSYQRVAVDTQYPNRDYQFYDNRHGHFMYFYMDRCLVSVAELLKKVPCRSWLIDGRGESDLYMPYAVETYRCIRDNKPYDEAYQRLKGVSNRPGRVGFFKHNKTDQTRRSNTVQDAVAHVLDVIKSTALFITVHQRIKVGDPLMLCSPEGHRQPMTLTWIKHVDGQLVDVAYPGDYVSIAWVKRASARSQLVLDMPMFIG